MKILGKFFHTNSVFEVQSVMIVKVAHRFFKFRKQEEIFRRFVENVPLVFSSMIVSINAIFFSCMLQPCPETTRQLSTLSL